MPETPVTAIQAIQAILAPALGISAVGLLLLSLSNRYSTIINRIRLLNDEKRRYSRQIGEKGDLLYPDNIRFMSISKQTEELLIRSRFVRNAILFLQGAIGLFVLSSVTIALNLFMTAETFKTVPLIVFIVGMCCVLIAVIYYGMDVYRSYKIILMEVRGEE